MYGRLGRGAPLAVFLAAGLLVAYKLLPVLKLVAVAMLVAVVLRSVARGLERLKLPPWTTLTAFVEGYRRRARAERVKEFAERLDENGGGGS